MLCDPDQRRYARQLMLAEIGVPGQQRLAESSVLIVGAGGLGSVVIAYLAAAGVGRIGVIDHDHVELSNLQRQIIHEQADCGRLKVESAADRISELNPQVRVDVFPRRLNEQNAQSILRGYDVVADGCDDFATRQHVNAACTALAIPLVSAAVKGFVGQLSVFHPAAGSACYRCLVPDVPPRADTCREVGVVGPTCGTFGSLQAMEVMKLLLGRGDTLLGKLLRYDLLSHRQSVGTILTDPACPICSACSHPSDCA